MTSTIRESPSTPASSTTSVPFRVSGLDGLRALAVTLVIVYHLSPVPVLPGGFIGVDVFFVISGFLITSLLLREWAATGRIRLGAFWLRRARRLVPALLLLLLVCGAAAALIGGDLTVRLGSQVIGAVTFSSNWLLIAQGSDYFGGLAPELLRNLWSLAVEEQFYLLWPFAVIALSVLPERLRPIVVAALAAASLVAMALLLDPGDATRVYYGTDTHSFGLSLGALLAVIASSRWARSERVPRTAGPVGESSSWSARHRLVALVGVLAIGGLVALAVTMPEQSGWTFPWGLGGVAVLSAVTIGTLLAPASPVGRMLEWRPLRWIGVRSYGLYLWHWPVSLLIPAALPGWPRTGSGGWALAALALAATVLLAAFSYLAVEQPIRRGGFAHAIGAAIGWWKWGAGSRAAGAAVVLAVLAAGTLTGMGIAVGRDVTSAQLRIEEGARAIAAPPGSDGVSDGAVTAPAPARQVGGDQIVAIGDSVTLAAAPELEAQLPGILIDAGVSRQMSAAPDIVRGLRDSGALRPVLVLALGTNGPIDRAALDDVRRTIGPERELVLVNTQAPRGWEPGVNATLSAFAAEYRNVELSNWHDAIQPDLVQLNRDQVHFGGFGARVWTASLKDALQRLAELPPLRTARDYAGLPRPT